MTLRAFREQVARDLSDWFAGTPVDPKPHFGEDYAASPEAQALALRERGVVMNFLAYSFPPFPMWDLHVGLVPLDEETVSIGLHVSTGGFRVFGDDLARLGRALQLDVTQAEAVGEVQCNFPPLRLTEADPSEAVARLALLCPYAAAAAARAARAA